MTKLYSTPKIQMPVSHADIIDRPRLLSLLQQAHHKKITVIRAPAGYGKTTLLLQYFYSQNQPVAWFSIDKEDNDPVRFWTFFCHAIDQALGLSNLSSSMNSLIQSRESYTTGFFIDSLQLELSHIETPFSIVLDDLHIIENPIIYKMVENFIEYLPSHIHLFITTRAILPFPTTKWHVKQIINEINTDDIRFSPYEVLQFLHNTSLTHHEVEAIHSKTEGWISGIILMQLNGKNTRNERLIENQRYTSQYLWEEMLHNLPSYIQQFLIKTSILPLLDLDICNALTHRTDSFEILSALEEKGLFIIQNDGEKTSFRYHHLMIDALHTQLHKQFTQEELLQLALEAAQLLYHSEDIGAAIELALRFQLYDVAHQWLMTHYLYFCQIGQLTTYLRWLQVLRIHVSQVDFNLLVTGYNIAITINDTASATSITHELEALHEKNNWKEKEEYTEISHTYETTRAYAMIANRKNINDVLAILFKQVNEPNATDHVLPTPFVYNPLEYTLLRTNLAGKGNLPSIEDTERIASLFQQTKFRNLYVSAFITGIAAEIYFERNHFSLAKKYLDLTLEFAHTYDDASLFIPMYLLKVKLALAKQQFTKAKSILHVVQQLNVEKQWTYFIKITEAYCLIQEGQLVQAEEILEGHALQHPYWHLTNARLRIKLEQYDSALQSIIKVKLEAKMNAQIATWLEATTLETVCYIAKGEQDEAGAIFGEVVEKAATYYYSRTLVQEPSLHPLLQQYVTDKKRTSHWSTDSTQYFAFIQPLIGDKKGINDVLTPREISIYELLCNGFSNREIAETLNLSVGTIRIYLSTIYGKLGVNSRTQAILLNTKQLH